MADSNKARLEALFYAGVTIVLAVLCYSMWSLGAQNRELRSALVTTLGSNVPPALVPGDRLPEIRLVGLDGTEMRLQDLYSGPVGVVTFFNTTCPYCELTLPTWRDIASSMTARGLVFAGVSFHSISRTGSYREQQQIEWPLFSLAAADASNLKVRSVPTTVVFSRGGQVRRVWVGALGQSEVADVMKTVDDEMALSTTSDGDLPPAAIDRLVHPPR